MEIVWGIENSDIDRLLTFIQHHENPFVEKRISRNVNRQGITLDRNSILKAIIMCLLTTQQRSGPNTPISIFLRQPLFPITIENLNANKKNVEYFVRTILQRNGLNRYINRIPSFFAQNFQHIETSHWEILQILTALNVNSTKLEERRIADNINEVFSGFGPKQSRNFLQSLGLTKYEVPIDSRITSWLNDFGFPVKLSSTALQDKGYYHFVSDGIQELCDRAKIYPCVLDAAIFSSFDNGLWTEENTIY